MTVHKAMYGIDPILSDKIKMSDFPKKDKKTLILFDESDQAAIAMRDTIIDQSIDNGGGQKRYANGYNGYLQYKTLLESPIGKNVYSLQGNKIGTIEDMEVNKYRIEKYV